MLLMTRRAGAVLNDVRLVQRVPNVTGLTLLIDRLESNATLEPITQQLFEFCDCKRTARHQRFVVTARTVVAEAGVIGGNCARVEKCFTAAHLKNGDADDPADDGQNADPSARPPPRMQPTVIAEIGFVALGDLLLRASWLCHRRGLNQWRAGALRRRGSQELASPTLASFGFIQ